MKPYNELVKPFNKFIELRDLCELIGIKHSCSAFLSTFHSENNTYVPIDCSDYRLEELYDIETYDDTWFMRGYYGKKWREKYNNEVKLIETLRETYGICDTILTYVSW